MAEQDRYHLQGSAPQIYEEYKVPVVFRPLAELTLRYVEVEEGAGYAKANKVRSSCCGLLNNVFEDIDVICCPTMTTPPFPITLEEMYGATALQGLPDWGRFTVPFDFSGAPTISLPCGQTGDGLPLSIQFVGKHLSEPLLCRLGHTFEQNTQWHHVRPNTE